MFASPLTTASQRAQESLISVRLVDSRYTVDRHRVTDDFYGGQGMV
jgi:hypothetical protein